MGNGHEGKEKPRCVRATAVKYNRRLDEIDDD